MSRAMDQTGIQSACRHWDSHLIHCISEVALGHPGVGGCGGCLFCWSPGPLPLALALPGCLALGTCRPFFIIVIVADRHCSWLWDSKLLTGDCLSPDDVLHQETPGLHDLVVMGTPLWLASPTLLLLLHNIPHPGSHVLVVLLALGTSGRRLQLLSDSVPPAVLGRHVEPLLLLLVIQLGFSFMSSANLNSASSVQRYSGISFLDTRTLFFFCRCLVSSSSLDGCLWLSSGSCCVSRITSTLDMGDWGEIISLSGLCLRLVGFWPSPLCSFSFLLYFRHVVSLI